MFSLVGHRPPKRPTGEAEEDAPRIADRVCRDDFDAIGMVVDWRGALREITEDSPMALGRPGFVDRPFHVDPLHRQPGPGVLVGPDRMHQLGRGQPIGQNRNAGLGLDVFDKLEHFLPIARTLTISFGTKVPQRSHTALCSVAA